MDGMGPAVIVAYDPGIAQEAASAYSFRSRYSNAYETQGFIRAFFTAFKMPEQEAGIRRFLSESIKNPRSVAEIGEAALGITAGDLQNRYVCDLKIQKAVRAKLSSLQTKITLALAPGMAFSHDRLAKIEASKKEILALEVRYNYLTLHPSPSSDKERRTIRKRLTIEVDLYKSLTQRHNFIRSHKKSFESAHFNSLTEKFTQIAEPFKDLGFVNIPTIPQATPIFRDRISIDRDLEEARSAGSKILEALLNTELQQLPIVSSEGTYQGIPRAEPPIESDEESISL